MNFGKFKPTLYSYFRCYEQLAGEFILNCPIPQSSPLQSFFLYGTLLKPVPHACKNMIQYPEEFQQLAIDLQCWSL